MPILVEKVRINNFRSLKDIDVKLEPLTLLVGANNAGKTSFLRALNLALGIERKSVTKEDLFINQRGEVTDKTIIIDVKIIPTDEKGIRVDEFDDDWLREFSGVTNETEGNQSFVAFRTKYAFDGNSEDAKSEKFVIRSAWNSPNINENTDILPSASLKNIPLYFIDAQRDIIDDLRNRTSYFGKLSAQIDYEEVAKSKLEGDLKTLNEDAVRNSKVMSHVKTNLENLNSTLRSGGSGVEITPFPKKVRDLHKSIKVHFQDANSDTFELDYHGMGTRSWASLLAFKAYVSWENSVENTKRRNPFYPILALEEPEAHLHPNAQRQLYKQLKSIAGQKIISTHSPYIVGLADLEEIRYFSRKGDTAEVKAIDLTGITSEEILSVKNEIFKSKGEILFSNAVVLSEGNTEERVLPIFAQKYLDAEPYQYGINFIGCGGNNYKLLLKICNTLEINWFLFSDYDKVNIKRGVDNALREIGVNNINIPQVICLNNGLEEYLVSEGYQEELRGAIFNSMQPFHNSHHELAKQREINNWNDVQLLEELKKEKKLFASFYAETISNITDENRRYPPKIKDLFEAIKIKLGI
jgi:putative ATP-dependent endonuclease of the OLD family